MAHFVLLYDKQCDTIKISRNSFRALTLLFGVRKSIRLVNKKASIR